VKQARMEGYRSRAVYKLLEIHTKHKLFKPWMKIVDIGCAPGSWSQLAAKFTQSTDSDPSVIGVDYLEVQPIPGVIVINGDVRNCEIVDRIHLALGKRLADVVLSDVLLPSAGHKQIDHWRAMDLCRAVIKVSCRLLRPSGNLLLKILIGGTENELISDLKKDFSSVLCIKPQATRSSSSELYLLAKKFSQPCE